MAGDDTATLSHLETGAPGPATTCPALALLWSRDERERVGEVTLLDPRERAGFDPQTRQILLYNPKIDRLAFVNESAVTKRLRADVQAAWEAQVTNPIRAELPPHPFITPFKDGIQGVTYVNGSIFVQVGYLKVSGN